MMTAGIASESAEFFKGSRLYGYLVKRVIELPEINARFFELDHLATGARHIHIGNQDSENTFSVAFKTVPQDSTGVAHILEHTVLCGSKKYPVRDPFFSMLKRSLSTFMNAFTASDWTMYPFSSQNRKDFFNLLAVYLDAVLFPNLEPLNFKQEGHRLEMETDENESPLVYKGIVYNEMKGAMSSPEQVMTRSLLNALFPSTTYRHNSGGDPKVIPSLTYQQLTEFHKRHYHPSNAFFYTYGDIPLKDILAFIQDTVLKDFQRIDPKTEVISQPLWYEPKEKNFFYPLSKEEDASKKCQTCVSWLTADIKDHFDVLCLLVLEQILLGNSASPLRKALIDSGLGTALSDGTGYISDIRNTLFTCGLKDVKQEAAEEIGKIIFTVLEDLVEQGIEKSLIESAIHQLEFHRKEVTNHPYPYGLKMLLSFSGSWVHGGDPVSILLFNADIDNIRQEVEKGRFFEDIIQKYFLDNPHRVRLTLLPDQEMEEKENRRLTAELEEVRLGLKPSEIEKIKKDTESLRQLQESMEDLSCLPTLALKDIPPFIKRVEETDAYGSVPATCYQQPTAGIFYFSSAIGVGTLEKQLFPFVPFFCQAFTRVGTALQDYTDMAQRIDAYTGGIGVSAHARIRFGSNGLCLPFITLNGKCLHRNEGKLFDILQELLFHSDFSNLTRLKHLLLEYRAGLESMIIPGGHRLAMLIASRNFSISSALDEIWHGIHQLKFIKKITDDLKTDELESVSAALSAIGKSIFNNSNFKAAVIGEGPALSEALLPVTEIQKGLESGTTDGFQPPDIAVEDQLPREGWTTASAVSYVARTFPTVPMEHVDSPALLVTSKLFRSLYLHREIREKGGAYGGFALYSLEDGLFSFASYRDPHVVSTLKVYDSAIQFIRSGKITDEDIKEAVLQICSDIDKPDPPGPAARKAFYRKIISLDDTARSRFKQKILAITRDQVNTVAEKYFNPDRRDYAVAVISSEEKLRAANEKLKSAPLTLHKI